MKPEIGFQLSSITRYLDTEESIKTSFEKVAAIGYKYVQLQGVPANIDNNVIANELRNSGLTCVATQEDYPFGFGENPEAAIERAVVCGCKYLAFALIPRDVETPEQLSAFAEKIARIRELAERAGLTFSFHPIGSDFRAMEGVPVYRRLLELLPGMRLTFCFHASFGSGVSAESVFAEYGDRIDLVHFKDSVIMPDGKTQLMPLGEGTHDWKPYYELCAKYNVKYVFAEQEQWLTDAFDCARASYEYLRSVAT